jgi:hypothetical protein
MYFKRRQQAKKRRQSIKTMAVTIPLWRLKIKKKKNKNKDRGKQLLNSYFCQ